MAATIDKKTLLVGLDAACWEYLDPLLLAGRLPNLAGLMGRGVHGVLRSVMPPITPTAWSSLVTGVNPGKHGIFDWVSRHADSYQFSPVSARQRVGTTVWRRLNAAGIRTGVVNIPLTHPPEAVEGFMLCGFSAPAGARNLTYPPELLPAIEARYGPYRPDILAPPEGPGSPQAYQAERSLQARLARLAIDLANCFQVQVLFINLMLLDHANHGMPDMVSVEQAMIHSDADLGLLLGEFAPDNTLLISDHGSRRVKGVFLLGAWLAEHGYLKRLPRPRNERAQVINYLLRQASNGEGSLTGRLQRRILREGLAHLPRALTRRRLAALEQAIPLARLQIETLDRFTPLETQVYPPGSSQRGNLSANQLGREPQGIVREQEKAALLGRLRAELSAIRTPQSKAPLFGELYEPESLYYGPFTKNAPDLTGDYYTSQWSMAFNLPGLARRRERYFLASESWYGDHSREGIYVFAGSDFLQLAARGQASLLDIPATLLYLYEVPQPADYDGMPLTHLLAAGHRQIHYQPGEERQCTPAGESYAGDEEREILDRLRDLGYLD